MKCLTILLSCLFAAQPALAQPLSKTSSFADVVDVEVINLEVYATDKSGNPVTGLDRGDFELQANGKPVEITNFYAVAGGERLVGEISTLPEEARQTTLETIAAPAEPLFLVVFLDNVHTSAFGRNRVLEQLRPFLKERIQDGNQVMLVTYDGNVDLRQGFTREWRKVRTVIDELEAEPGLGHRREREHVEVIETIVRLSDLHSEIAVAELRTKCPREIESLARSFSSEIYGRVHGTVERLGDFVETLGSLPGRKALLHVSDGLHVLPGAEVFEYLCQLCGNCANDLVGEKMADFDEQNQRDDGRFSAGSGAGQLSYDGTRAPLDALQNNALELFEELTERANAHRVTFFTLEAYGPRQLASASAQAEARTTSLSVERVRVSSLQDSLNNMAERTGGRAILNTIDFKPALAKIGKDFDSYYSLGYLLPLSAEGRDVQVKVKVLRPGVRVRYRKSLHTQPLSEQLASRTRATLMYGDLGAGGEENPLGITLQVGRSEPLDGSLHMVPIRVLVPLENVTLVPDGEESRGQLTLYLAARDRTGKMAPVRTSQIPLRFSKARLVSTGGQPYVYEVKMLMRKGDHAVTVGLHDDIGQVASYLTESVMVFPSRSGVSTAGNGLPAAGSAARTME